MNASRRNDTTRQPDHRAGGRSTRKRNRDVSDDFEDVKRAIQAMETTFITIHDLTADAKILYCSQSIADVLDYKPENVVGKPAWDFFHPEEISFARNVHGRGVQLDKASVLHYCRIRNRHGEWVGCECVFTVVYNVLIGCTSVYLDGPKAKKRAVEAPVVRQLFSSSPRDPRYHMLSYISSKFRSGPRPHVHEPRAALFLNRFTRSLTINFATDGLEHLLGIPADEMQGKSFYYCIQQNCLAEAVRCLESAKANDSIAYLRFWYRDPRLDDLQRHNEILSSSQASDSDDKEDSLLDEQADANGSDGNGNDDDDDDDDDEEEGGVRLTLPEIHIDGDASDASRAHAPNFSPSNSDRASRQNLTPDAAKDAYSRQSSSNETDLALDGSSRSFDHSSGHRSSTPRTAMSLDSPPYSSNRQEMDGRPVDARDTIDRFAPSSRAVSTEPDVNPTVELEAVISCTSDGLVVVLRAARPFVPNSVRVPSREVISPYSNGLFASPWATKPILPDHFSTSAFGSNDRTDGTTTSSPSIGVRHPAFNQPLSTQEAALVNDNPIDHQSQTGGPHLVDFMKTIRDVAVFAWALTGINGSLQQYGRGRPLMGAIPHSGLPIWDREASGEMVDRVDPPSYREEASLDGQIDGQLDGELDGVDHANEAHQVGNAQMNSHDTLIRADGYANVLSNNLRYTQ